MEEKIEVVESDLLEKINLCEKAIKENPNDYDAFMGWGNALRILAEIKTGKEADDLCEQASEKYMEALRLALSESRIIKLR